MSESSCHRSQLDSGGMAFRLDGGELGDGAGEGLPLGVGLADGSGQGCGAGLWSVVWGEPVVEADSFDEMRCFVPLDCSVLGGSGPDGVDDVSGWLLGGGVDPPRQRVFDQSGSGRHGLTSFDIARQFSPSDPQPFLGDLKVPVEFVPVWTSRGASSVAGCVRLPDARRSDVVLGVDDVESDPAMQVVTPGPVLLVFAAFAEEVFERHGRDQRPGGLGVVAICICRWSSSWAGSSRGAVVGTGLLFISRPSVW